MNDSRYSDNGRIHKNGTVAIWRDIWLVVASKRAAVRAAKASQPDLDLRAGRAGEGLMAWRALLRTGFDLKTLIIARIKIRA